jgi:beta-mannosidase
MGTGSLSWKNGWCPTVAVEGVQQNRDGILKKGIWAYATIGQPGETIICCDLYQGDSCLETAVFPFLSNKDLQLEDPKLSMLVAQDGQDLVVEVRARSLARFVELSIEGADPNFSDSYFDLPAGRTFQVKCSLPQGWSLERSERAIQVRSLYGSYS